MKVWQGIRRYAFNRLMPGEGIIVSLGRIVGLHGVRGYLKLKPWGDVEAKDWKRLIFKKGDSESLFEVEELKPHKNILLVKLKGIDGRDDRAVSLVGSEVFIDRCDLKPLPEDEYYWFELIGLKVFTDTGRPIGRVDELIATGSNDVLVIKDGKEYLVPVTREALVSIDREKGVITVREGVIAEGG